MTLLPEAIAAVQQALLDRMRLQNAVDQYQTAKQHAAQLQAAMELSSSRQASGDTLELTQTLSRLRGKLEALGYRAAVETQREALSERLGLLRRHYDAAQIALDALQQARDTLQARFAPPLRRLTAQYLAQLTGGAHCQISIDRQMQLDLQDEKDPASHPSGYYSGGTRDQISLALRLAIEELLLEPDVPYILDDALVCFDEQRLAYALEFLQQQAARRQLTICEREIAKAEERIGALDAEMEANACDYEKLNALVADKDAAQAELDALYLRWEELSEAAGEA